MKSTAFPAAALILALALITIPHSTAGAQDADTVRVDDGRITIIVEDGAVVVREGRGATAEPRVRREMRIERSDSPRGIWMMHRDEDGADTLMVDVDRIARMAERAAARVPRHFDRWLSDLEPGAPLGEMMHERSEIMRKEAEARELARRARSAEGAERDRLETELRAHLDELFAEKIELERERLLRMQERLEKGQRELDERRARRGEIIERRHRELLGDRDVLDW